MGTALLIVNFLILSPESLKEYKSQVGPTLKLFRGTPVISGAKKQILGGSEYTHISIFRFPDENSIHDWFKSKEYQKLSAIRNKAIKAEFLIVNE